MAPPLPAGAVDAAAQGGEGTAAGTAAGTAGGVHAISLRAVSKVFRQRALAVEALGSIDLDIAAGEFVSVIGASGCGKSTLLRVIGGLLAPDGGSVLVHGRPAAEARRAKTFGLVPQTPSLLPWRNVLDNVTLLRDVGAGAAQAARQGLPDPLELLDSVGLADFAASYPAQLSGGMQQRVGLVRAFVLGAPVLLMDEPFAALDELTRQSMRYQLQEIWGRAKEAGTPTTVLFVTHSIAEAVVLSDRVLTMAGRPGRFVHEERIELPRPRHEDVEFAPSFLVHAQRLRQALRAADELVGA